LIFTILLSLSVKAQQGVVKGKLKDTLTLQPVAGATITLMTRADSALTSFTMSNDKGEFMMTGIANGNYRLLITHINYHNSNKLLEIISTNKEVDLGTIPLGDKYKTLNEIVIEAEAPSVTLKADTIEYNAGSFKTIPNANVEDMLKKLPGVKVDKDGTVRAQGQKVNRVFVDGKEFFGNDPKIATRNLPADAVDKVQVYDRKSEQADLTGFDDGNSEKAINLKLKKDKKKGLFGKISGGLGTDDRYEGRFNVNSFKNEKQLSAIGMANNTNAEGFSFMDLLNFSSAGSGIQRSGGNVSITMSADDPNAALMGLGGSNNSINTTAGGGINYNNQIGKKTDIRSNYFYSRFNPLTESQLQREYLLPDSSYFYDQSSRTDNVNNNHRLNFSLEHRFDSTMSLRVSPSLGLQSSQHNSTSTYQTLSGQKTLTNNGATTSISDNSGYNARNELLFRKKFNNKGRTFSLNLANSWNHSDGDGTQRSLNQFYNQDGTLFRRDSINQQSIFNASTNAYSLKAAYTEPFGKRLLMELSADRSNSKATSNRETFDYNSLNGKYDELNNILSNDFSSNYSYTTAGAKLRYQKKKFNIALGSQWQEAKLNGIISNSGKDTSIGQKFYNLLPNARFQYNFNRFRNLSFNYFTATNQPMISQLQPIPDISNPLNIRIGNPKLQQEFTHIMTLNYMSVTPFKSTNFFAFLNMRYTNNRIVNSDSITPFGVKYTIPVNVNGVYNVMGDINWGIPIKPIKNSTLNLGLNGGKARDIQFINGQRNDISTTQIRPEVRIENNTLTKLNAGLNYSSVYYRSKYSLQPALNVKYFTHEFGSFVNWQLPKNFHLSTDFTYIMNGQRAAGFNENVPLWNASFSKLFLKYNRGEFKFRVFDLLNQNIGISRTSNNNYIEDTRTRIIKRYFMLSFTYSLSKQAVGNNGGGMIRVIR
jgi:hypothetical protein